MSLPIVEEDLVIVEPSEQQYKKIFIVRELGCGYC